VKIVIEAKKKAGFPAQGGNGGTGGGEEEQTSRGWAFRLRQGVCSSRSGDFLRIGGDLYISVDEELMDVGHPLVFLDAALKISRAMIAAAARSGTGGELDTR